MLPLLPQHLAMTGPAMGAQVDTQVDTQVVTLPAGQLLAGQSSLSHLLQQLLDKHGDLPLPLQQPNLQTLVQTNIPISIIMHSMGTTLPTRGLHLLSSDYQTNNVCISVMSIVAT